MADVGALVLDSVEDGIAVLRPCDGAMLLAAVNRGFEKLLGYAAAEVVGWPVEHVFGNALSQGSGFDPSREPRSHRFECTVTTKGGDELRLNVTVRPFELDGSPGGLLVLRDVTEYRRLEQIAAATELSESVASVLAGIRHEIGNPINSLKSVLFLLSDPGVTLPPERRNDYLRRSLAEIVRIETLLEQLRPFNTHESVRLERMRIRPFLERFVHIAREDCARRATELALELEPDVDPEVTADHRLLHQVLLLLLSNALDAVETVRARRIVLATSSDSRTCRISMTDSGVGMTPDQLSNAQRPFVTTKSKGTGLGLPLVKRYAALMRCTFEISSTPGFGTSGTLEIERTDSSRERSE
jgi:PAS domain S-box-containing protein